MPYVKPETPTVAVAATAALSWLGLYIHNVADLPDQHLLSPETAYPTVMYLAGIAIWFTPARRAAAWLLLGWGWLHLVVGGVLSVLPLPIWPYDPEQTVRHYAFHLLYAVLQTPLIIFTSRHLRRPTTRPEPASR